MTLKNSIIILSVYSLQNLSKFKLLHVANRNLYTLLYKNVKWLIPLFALVPIGIFWYSLFKYSLNIPIGDDYRAILLFLIKFLECSEIIDKIVLMFSQHNEHRIFFTRSIVLGYYYLFNSINFKNLILVGNFSLFGIIFVLFKSFKQNKDKFIYFTVVIFLLFQPLYRETVYWAMASLSNLYVFFFAFLTVYLLIRPRYFLSSVILAVLTTFTNGNGICVFLVGLWILFYQKRYNELILWLLSTAIIIIFYFCNYTTQQVTEIGKDPVQHLAYFFAYLGSTAGFSLISYIPALLLGGIILTFFIYLCKKKYFVNNLAIFSYLLFLILTALTATLARSSFGIEQACSSKYRIISIQCIILLYLAISEMLDRKILRWYYPICLVVSILLNFLSWHFLTKYVIARQNATVAYIIKYKTNDSLVNHHFDDSYDGIMIKAQKKKIYRIPKLEFIETDNIKFAIDSLKIKTDSFAIDGYAYINRQSVENSKINIILRSDIKTYIFPAELRRKADTPIISSLLNFNSARFHASIPMGSMEKNTYRIGFYITKENINAVQYSNTTVKIEENKP